MFHFDTYRLKNDDEFLELGAEEYVDAGGITLVEWADRVTHLLPAERVDITLEVTGDTTRRVTIAATSDRLQAAIELIGRGGWGRAPASAQ